MKRQIITQWIVGIFLLIIGSYYGWQVFSIVYDISSLDRKMSSVILPGVQLDMIPQKYSKYLATYPADCATSGCEHMRDYAINLGLNLAEEQDLYTISKGHMNFYFTAEETSASIVLKQVVREKS